MSHQGLTVSYNGALITSKPINLASDIGDGNMAIVWDTSAFISNHTDVFCRLTECIEGVKNFGYTPSSLAANYIYINLLLNQAKDKVAYKELVPAAVISQTEVFVAISGSFAGLPYSTHMVAETAKRLMNRFLESAKVL